jgi:hypothetical protein
METISSPRFVARIDDAFLLLPVPVTRAPFRFPEETGSTWIGGARERGNVTIHVDLANRYGFHREVLEAEGEFFGGPRLVPFTEHYRVAVGEREDSGTPNVVPKSNPRLGIANPLKGR